MTTTADRSRIPEELPGQGPGELERAYARAVGGLVGDSRAEAAAVGRQVRGLHRMWVLQVAAQERHRAELTRWLSAHGRRVPTPEPAYRPLLDVADEIGPALHLPAVTAVHRVEHAIVLAVSLPGVLQALEAGVIGAGQAEVIAEFWKELRGGQLHPAPLPRPPAEAVARGAVDLLELARSGTVAQLRARAARLRRELTGSDGEARHRAARRRRRVWVEAQEDGMARLCALLDAATAHAIQHRLVCIAARVHPDGPPAAGTPGTGEGAGRTPGQLRADVLADLLLAGEPADMPEHLRGIRGPVTVTVPALTLLHHRTPLPEKPAPATPRPAAAPGPGAAPEKPTPGRIPGGRAVPEGGDLPGGAEPGNPAPGREEPGGAESGNPAPGGGLPGGAVLVPAALPGRWAAGSGCAELAGYGPIPDSVAAAIAAGAPSWTRILTHPLTGAVLAHDRTTYTVPADLKRHLRARDGTCRFPGCGRAAQACDLDHTIAWADGGTTAAGNLAHLCRAHHRLKHRHGPLGRWRVEQPAQEEVLAWTSPAGRVHVTYPQQHHHPVLTPVRIEDPLPTTPPPPGTTTTPGPALPAPGTGGLLRSTTLLTPISVARVLRPRGVDPGGPRRSAARAPGPGRIGRPRPAGDLSSDGPRAADRLPAGPDQRTPSTDTAGSCP